LETYQLRHFRQVLGRRYEFQAFLGRGAFASVYLVQNMRLKRREALKILADTFEADSAARFVAEATMVASLDHPNIVQVYDYGEVEGVIWYSMQYIEGPMLRDEMWARQRFDAQSAVRIAIPLLGALEASHRQGIVHRDIKPSNVILNRQGRPYLMDFGIAKADDGHLKTMTGGVLGTPAFMAPEQAEGKPLDGRADLYSLGLVLYQMLAGRSPFEAKEPVQLLLLRLREDPPRLATLVPEIDPELDAIIMRTLARDREARFPSARELERHLIAFLGDVSDLPPFALVAPVFELQALEPESAPQPGGSATVFLGSGGRTVAKPPPAGRLLRNLAFGVAAVLALVAAVLLGGRWLGGERIEQKPASAPRSAGAIEPVSNPQSAAPQESVEAGGGIASPAAVLQPTQPSATGVPAAVRPAPRVEPLRRDAPPTPSVSNPVDSAAPRRAVRFPRLVERAEPSLSGEAVALCAGTSVTVSIQVGEDGRPVRVRTLGATPAECRASAEAAARQYLFEPAQDVEGRPVAATTAMAIFFGEVR
jgi:serine/threonine-protein kinase